MSILNFFKKSDFDYATFAQWLDASLSGDLPSEIAAFGFNIYEDGDYRWALELIGSSWFDKDNSDWACDEVFTTRDTSFTWKSKKAPDAILADVRKALERYLLEGQYHSILQSKQGIGLGFVDGDLILF